MFNLLKIQSFNGNCMCITNVNNHDIDATRTACSVKKIAPISMVHTKSYFRESLVHSFISLYQ